MKKYLFIVLALIGSSLLAQELLYSNQQIELKNDSIYVYQEAGFPFGYGSNCPKVISYALDTTEPQQIELMVYYDASGPWLAAGCISRDTLILSTNDLSGNFTLFVHTNVLAPFLSDTNLVDIDTFSNLQLSIEEIFDENFNIPNPVQNTLFIGLDNINAEYIELLNISGKVIYKGNYQEELDVSFLPNGVFILKIHGTDRIFTKKLLST